jgi:hypothetical protein
MEELRYQERIVYAPAISSSGPTPYRIIDAADLNENLASVIRRDAPDQPLAGEDGQLAVCSVPFNALNPG